MRDTAGLLMRRTVSSSSTDGGGDHGADATRLRPTPPLPINASPRRPPLLAANTGGNASATGLQAPPVNPRSSSSFLCSPSHPHRVKKESFPREKLWSWNQPAAPGGHPGNSHGALSSGSNCKGQGQAQADIVEAVLRESHGSIIAAGPPMSAIPLGSMNERRLPSSLPAQDLGSLLSASPSMSVGGSMHSSRRRLGKKEPPAVPPVVAAPSQRNTPATGTRDMDGWKAYKLAHRTNRLMAKTRKAIEVMTRDKNTTISSEKWHASGSGGDGGSESDGDCRVKRAQDRASGDLKGDELEQDFIGNPRALTKAELFQRDVCDSDDDDVESNEQRIPETVNALPVPNVDDGEEGVHGAEEFWKIYKAASTTKRPNSARGRYIERCEQTPLLVLPVLDLKRPSRYSTDTKALRYDNYYFGDPRAEALGDALQLLPVAVNKLSMKNVGITGSGSSAIVSGLSMQQLEHLNFSENRIGPKGALTILQGLQDPLVCLKTLDLGNNQLGDQSVKVLMQCLVNRCTLEHLDLRKNSIYHSAREIGELLRISTPLKSLNLSWNHIRGAPAQYLATCMMENITLTSLNLADNSLGNNGKADAELGACLASNKSLLHLDVSRNHIHGRSVLVYVNGLQQGRSILNTLIIRGNPIGSLGTEAVLRAAASGSLATCKVDIGDCNLDLVDTSQQLAIYSGGVYNLNMSDRGDVVLLRELLLLNWRNKTEITEAIHNSVPFTFNRKDEKTFLQAIPASGLMQVKVQPTYDRHEEIISDEGLACIMSLLERSFGECRDSDESAKLTCIRLLAEEHSFHVGHVNTLLTLFRSHTAHVEKATAAALLIPQIHTAREPTRDPDSQEDDTDAAIYDCASMVIPEEFFEDKDKDGKIDVCGDICIIIGITGLSDVQQTQVEQRVGKWISFNSGNPTGRYKLNMSNPIDRRILMRILENNRNEKRLRTHFKLMDTSQHGVMHQPLQGGFRNVTLNRVPLPMNGSWQFPRLGILEFDYTQTKRPYQVCTPLSEIAFEQFLREFRQLDVDAETKLIGLRSISTSYYFHCAQVQRLIEHFGTFERDRETGILFRAEVFVILFARIVDEWNFPETLALLDLATKRQVQERLGCLHLFHPLQPAEQYEQLQFTAYDHRQFIIILVKLAISSEIELSDIVLNENTVVEPDQWKTWTSDEKLPAAGILSCAMRSPHGTQAEAQLPPNCLRKRLLQSLVFKLTDRQQEHI